MSKQRTLVCPHCGCDDLDQMTYEEDAIEHRGIRLVDGVVVCMTGSSQFDSEVGWCWIFCRACHKRFDIPDWAELEFDDDYKPANEEVA